MVLYLLLDYHYNAYQFYNIGLLLVVYSNTQWSYENRLVKILHHPQGFRDSLDIQFQALCSTDITNVVWSISDVTKYHVS